MSGYSEVSQRVTVKGSAFIQKPFTEHDLLNKVRGVLGGP
jgi:hypothetical protein